jgi:uncharacterized short protein YbdD (DUF466 family)
MALNEASNEPQQAIMQEPTTDRLEDVSLPTSPDLETQGVPEYRAYVAAGRWKAPDSGYKVNESVHLKLKNGNTAGPFCIIRCHTPRNPTDKWRYDVQDSSGKTMDGISEPKLIGLKR